MRSLFGPRSTRGLFRLSGKSTFHPGFVWLRTAEALSSEAKLLHLKLLNLMTSTPPCLATSLRGWWMDMMINTWVREEHSPKTSCARPVPCYSSCSKVMTRIGVSVCEPSHIASARGSRFRLCRENKNRSQFLKLLTLDLHRGRATHAKLSIGGRKTRGRLVAEHDPRLKSAAAGRLTRGASTSSIYKSRKPRWPHHLGN